MKATMTPFSGRNPKLLAVTGLLVAATVAAALVPGFRTTVAGEPAAAVSGADLSVVGVDMNSTTELKRETRRPGGAGVDAERVDAPAAEITFRNRGEQTARVTKLTVRVSKVWAPTTCDDAGKAATSVKYDFVLPANIGDQRFPLTMSKEVDREVASGVTDMLAVTIGEQQLGGTGWAWVTSASAELELADGRSATTGEFVVMNSTEIDRTVALARANAANPKTAQQTGRMRCLQDNIALLEDAAAAPGVHSPSIRTLLDRLAQAGFTSRGVPGAGKDGADPAPPAKVEPPRDTWVAMLGSLPESTSPTQLQGAIDDLQERLGVTVQTVRSGAYASLAPGYRVLFHDGGFSDGHDALRFCGEHGITSENDCAGRYLSNRRGDFARNCHFSDPQGSARCSRP